MSSKIKVEKVKCQYKLANGCICGATEDLYYCPYCGDGKVDVYCRWHLEKHLTPRAFKYLEFEE